jgi:hypothetical protein
LKGSAAQKAALSFLAIPSCLAEFQGKLCGKKKIGQPADSCVSKEKTDWFFLPQDRG